MTIQSVLYNSLNYRNNIKLGKRWPKIIPGNRHFSKWYRSTSFSFFWQRELFVQYNSYYYKYWEKVREENIWIHKIIFVENICHFLSTDLISIPLYLPWHVVASVWTSNVTIQLQISCRWYKRSFLHGIA